MNRKGMISRTIGERYEELGTVFEQDFRNIALGANLDDMNAAFAGLYVQQRPILEAWSQARPYFLRDRDEALRAFQTDMITRFGNFRRGAPKKADLQRQNITHQYQITSICKRSGCDHHPEIPPLTPGKYMYEDEFDAGNYTSCYPTEHLAENGTHPLTIFSTANVVTFGKSKLVHQIHTRLKSEYRFEFKLTRRILEYEADMHDTIGAKIILQPLNQFIDCLSDEKRAELARKYIESMKREERKFKKKILLNKGIIRNVAEQMQEYVLADIAAHEPTKTGDARADGDIDNYFKYPKKREAIDPETGKVRTAIFNNINIPIKYAVPGHTNPLLMEVQVTPYFVYQDERDPKSPLFHPRYAKNEIKKKVFDIPDENRLRFLMTLNALHQFWSYEPGKPWRTLAIPELDDIQLSGAIDDLILDHA